MSSFWFNNVHFAVEFFGATVLLVAAWLALDAYLLTKEKRALVKVFGFACFGIWQVLHALDVTHEAALLSGMAVLVAGLFLVLCNVQQEAPPGRPKTFELLFYVPPVVEFAGYFSITIGMLAVLIAALSFRRYVVELNKPLRPFMWGFGFLAISFFLGSVSIRHLAPGGWWLAEHALKAAGFALLGAWSWQYLQLRLKEQLLLAFVTMSLLVSLVVTFTFSALLLDRMRADASISLESNARTFLYVLQQKMEEAKAKSINVASDLALGDAVFKKDFAALEERARTLRQVSGVDFLTVTDGTGEVLQRATLRTGRGEVLDQESVIAAALGGGSMGDISTGSPEGLSVRGASYLRGVNAPPPILGVENQGSPPPIRIGAVAVGFLIDNLFLDAFKKNTGLDITVFSGETLYASTLLDVDGQTRPMGVKLSDTRVRARVLRDRKTYTGTTQFFGRPHLASYLPLQDAKEKILGIIAVSRPEVEISKAAIATNRLTLFTTLFIVLALLLPGYLVVKKITEEA